MHSFSRFLVGFLLLAAPVWMRAQAPVQDIGPVEILTTVRTLPVRISATGELATWAQQAFRLHGAYRLVTTGHAYDLRFTAASATQVRVDVTRGADGAAVASQVFSGSNTRQALFRAADFAVERTSNLKGFFASRLAFISDRSGHGEVYTSDLLLGEVKQITRDSAHALTPRWSPDGSKLLYTSYFRSGFPDIFQIDMSSYQRSLFISFKGTNSGARYSPDGRQVAMVLSGEGNPEIYVSNAQGRQVARRTRTAAVEASPCFSPDGSRIVFTSDAAGGPQLYVMPAGGGSIQRLATNISGYCAEPDWSVGNPNKIAFTMRIGRGFQIAVYDLSTRAAAVQVSQAPMDAIEPTWLADGRHLVYTARSGNSRVLFVLDTENKTAVRLTPPALGNVHHASVLAP